jgi:hypothetical protein
MDGAKKETALGASWGRQLKNGSPAAEKWWGFLEIMKRN